MTGLRPGPGRRRPPTRLRLRRAGVPGPGPRLPARGATANGGARPPERRAPQRRDPDEAVRYGLRVAAGYAWRSVAVAVAVYLVFVALGRLHFVAISVFVGPADHGAAAAADRPARPPDAPRGGRGDRDHPGDHRGRRAWSRSSRRPRVGQFGRLASPVRDGHPRDRGAAVRAAAAAAGRRAEPLDEPGAGLAGGEPRPARRAGGGRGGHRRRAVRGPGAGRVLRAVLPALRRAAVGLGAGRSCRCGAPGGTPRAGPGGRPSPATPAVSCSWRCRTRPSSGSRCTCSRCRWRCR